MTEKNTNAREREVITAVKQLSNTDILWKGTFLGLMPTVKKTEILELLQAEKELSRPLLIECLTDRESFAAAHVVLTLMNDKPFKSSAKNWNGLEVQINRNNEVTYEGNELEALQTLWKKD